MSTKVDWDNEIRFWDAQLSGKGMYSADVLSRFDTSKPTWEYPATLEPLIKRLGDEQNRLARVADLGSGPASVLAHGYHEKRFDLVAIDPLADEYRRLIERHGLTPVSPMANCAGEQLLEKFGPDHFDFLWTFNAIDHCQAPQQLLDSVIGVTRPGGTILIQCWSYEGTEASWDGLHKHDFWKSPEGTLMWTTQDGTTTAFQSDKVKPLPADFVELPNQPKADHRDWLVFAFERI